MTLWQTLTGFASALLVIAGAVIVIMSQRAEEARKADRANVVSLNDLLKTRELQLSDRSRDLETLKAEHKQLIQVDVKEMTDGWFKQRQSACQQENARLRGLIEGCAYCEQRLNTRELKP